MGLTEDAISGSDITGGFVDYEKLMVEKHYSNGIKIVQKRRIPNFPQLINGVIEKGLTGGVKLKLFCTANYF